jgi:hypothetical protein
MWRHFFLAAKAGEEHVFKSTWLLDGNNHAERLVDHIFIF